MNEPTTPPNRLIHEKSPYLLQHAYNPVDWYPWGEEAFKKAQKEDKPVFLSIGYSTCHWCHVMEKESFEDSEVAGLLSNTFVCIKVDREERPDIDSVYMRVCQMMTGRGGWPLTIVLTPDKKPFFAATYIPKESRFGMTGLVDLIPRIKEVWMNQREEVLDSADNIVSALQATEVPEGEKLGEPVLESAYKGFMRAFDELYGGFGTVPKFPTPHNILFLLRYCRRFNEEKALEMVEKTLNAMRKGGIWDHVGFGFHRYSTDQYWLVPHFEKMLYDQALLALAYTEAYQVTDNCEYRKTAEHIFEYVLRDMMSPEGGFYSAEDADSEGVEGKFYTWSEEEVLAAVGQKVAKIFNVTGKGNFSEPGGTVTGKNILHIKKPLAALAEDMHISSEELNSKIEKARKILFEIREKRVHPGKDDKVLTDWNGLMIAALSRGAQILGNDTYKNAAQKAADFIIGNMMDSRLYHRYRDGDIAVPGFLDDYAFFVWGLIELYETTFNVKYVKTAVTLTEYMVTHFWDDEGGFYQTSDVSESILVRQKQSYDGASPSGNSVAALNLLRLAGMTGDTDLEEKASQIVCAFSNEVNQLPTSHAFLLTALDFAVGPSFEVAVVGDLHAEDTQEMVKALRKQFIPNKVTVFRPDEEPGEITSLAPFTKDLTTINGKATAYVCRNYICNLPTTDVQEMLEQLHEHDEL
ncbi:MAG: thioredoxin [Theionarchaea archaeon DG-70-1]|nr:MAG: thioredoxin [Theionarchaea archaeon DG-70-1]